ncbi:MAG: ABC transporter substrate-binding protein [Desulfovibrionaceae bacterium]|jgi:putative ABC transport system substrate-binding protein|nr:ABC transporter substrate-binding protein [Desulfovibrionaceae bacterium]
MKRLIVCAALSLLLALPTGASAKKVPVVSVNQFVEHPALDAVLKGFQDYFKDKNLQVTYNVHNAQANMATTTQIASQIMGEEPDLVLAIATPSAQACAQKIKDRPVLFTAVTDPVSAGLVAGIEAPGGNVTGLSDLSPVARQVDLIREFQPDVKAIGVIYNAGEANSVVLANLLKEACKERGIKVEEASVVNTSGVYQAAKSLVGRCEAVYVPTDNTVVSALESAVKIFDENNLPLYAADTASVPRGAVAALALDYYRMGRQAGKMANRIFNGSKTKDMPVEYLQDLKLLVSKKNAAAMGVRIPQAVLKRADKVLD